MNWAHPVTRPACSRSPQLYYSPQSTEPPCGKPVQTPPWVTHRELLCPGAAVSTGVALVP